MIESRLLSLIIVVHLAAWMANGRLGLAKRVRKYLTHLTKFVP